MYIKTRVKENVEMIEDITKTLEVLTDIPFDYERHALIRESINTTVFVDISKSLAVIADALKKEEISLDIEM